MMAGMNGGQCAYAMIREDLVSGRIRPGEKLMPQRLATRYGFSSAVLREALLKLSAEGFVENLPQRGFRSVSIDADTVWEIAHYRVLIEAEGARLSILRGDMKWEANLTAAHHLLSHLEEVMRGQDHSMEQLRYWSGCDRAFHEALIAACGSRRLIGQFRISFDQFKQHVIARDPTLGYRGEELVAEHADILQTALDRDPAACAAALRKHFDTYRRFSSRTIDW